MTLTRSAGAIEWNIEQESEIISIDLLNLPSRITQQTHYQSVEIWDDGKGINVAYRMQDWRRKNPSLLLPLHQVRYNNWDNLERLQLSFKHHEDCESGISKEIQKMSRSILF